MAAAILGPDVRLCRNAAGANLLSGIAAALVDGAGGGAPAELGLFECDEAALPAIVRRVRPHTIALGNLFRDQLDRYGELEAVAERWRDDDRRAPARDDADRVRRRPADRRHRVGARAAA